MSQLKMIIALVTIAVYGGAAMADGYDAPSGKGFAPPVSTYSWTGFSIGVGGGGAIMNADVNATGTRNGEIGFCDPDDCGPTFFPLVGLVQTQDFDLNDSGDAGFFGTIQLAYDHQVSSRWVIGAFIDFDWGSNVEASGSASNALDLSFGGVPVATLSSDATSNNIEQDWSFTLGGRIGLLANQRTLLYFLAAYTRMELDNAYAQMNFTDPLGFIGPINSPTSLRVPLADSLEGYTLGGGVETKLNHAVSLKFEYRYTDLESDSASASNTVIECCAFDAIARRIQEDASASMDLDLHSVRAVLSYKFGH